MASHSYCFTVSPSAGTPPYSVDFGQVTLLADVPASGYVTQVSAFLSGAGAPAPFVAAYGAATDNSTSDLAAGQIVTTTAPVTMTLDVDMVAFAGQAGQIGFGGSVAITDATGCAQVISVPSDYNCPFLAQVFNTAPDCPAPMLITCTAADVINFTSPAFTDADGQSIALSFIGVPVWLTVTDNGNGTFSATGTAPAGSNTDIITITASDGVDDCVTSLTVECSSGVNTAPICPPNASIDCDTDVPYTSALFTDADGDAITLTQIGLPTGFTFTDNGGGSYTITGSGQSGSMTVTADDGRGGTCFQILTISGCAAQGVGLSGNDCPQNVFPSNNQPVAQIFGPFFPFSGGATPYVITGTTLVGGSILQSGNGYSTIVPPNTPGTALQPYSVTAVDANNNTVTCSGNTFEISGL